MLDLFQSVVFYSLLMIAKGLLMLLSVVVVIGMMGSLFYAFWVAVASVLGLPY